MPQDMQAALLLGCSKEFSHLGQPAAAAVWLQLLLQPQWLGDLSAPGGLLQLLWSRELWPEDLWGLPQSCR